jgi:uncharacterized surface protein with fasciclin (FAS1) repeats
MMSKFIKQFVFLFAIAAITFSCNKEEQNELANAVTINDIEQFLGAEINTPEEFPDYKALTAEEIDRVLEHINETFDAQESSQIESRNSFFNYRLFVLAVVRSGLVNDIINKEVTAFAPNNDAFRAIGIPNYRALLDVPVDALRAILEYHIIPDSRLFAADLESRFYPTVATQAVRVNVSASGVTVNDVDVIEANFFLAFFFNGVVHGIDEVLMAPDQNIVEIAVAAANGNPAQFTQLVAAVVRADLAGTLSGNGPFTVFAPTDAAFNELFAALNTDVNSIDINVLTDVLLYHVVPARVFSTDLAAGPVSTLNGDVNISVNHLTVGDTTDEPANLIPSLLDIQGSNGVIHVIDKVLIPEL